MNGQIGADSVAGHAESRPLGPGALLALLTALSAFGMLATNLYLPSLPSLARTLGTDARGAQATLSVFLAGFAVAQLIAGPLSDRYGRRPVLLAGAALYAAASALCAMAQSLDAMLAFRVVQAIGACAGTVLVRAILRDLYQGPALTRAFAIITTFMAAAPGFSPLIGGVIETGWGWRANFIAIAVFPALAGLAARRRIGETNRQPLSGLSPAAMARDYLLLLVRPAFIGPAAAVALALGGLFAYFAATPALFVGQLGLTPAQFGLIPAGTVPAVFLGGALSPGLARRLGERTAIFLALALMMAGGALMTVLFMTQPPGLVMAIAPFVLFLLGLGLVNPLATAAAVRPFPHHAGTASALIGFLQMAAGTLTTLTSTLLPLPSNLALPVTILACAVLGIGLYAIAPRQD
ncbi:MAG: multidrug effflux MFS transporter [Ferrovibrionaceae bacterium]